jgi:hypothetical protein
MVNKIVIVSASDPSPAKILGKKMGEIEKGEKSRLEGAHMRLAL